MAEKKSKKEKQAKGGALAIIPENQSVQAMTPDQMRSAMSLEAEKRKLITQYISFHMKDGVDYGSIHISRGCREFDETKECRNKKHWSRPNLFKPGSEKFVSLFKLRPMFKKDEETLSMVGEGKSVFAFICQLQTMNGDVVGEGRGAAALGEKQSWTINNAIKIAQKRAQIDAVLRTGALSDFFTQDLEDSPIEAVVDNVVKAPTAPKAKADTEKLFTEAKEMIAAQNDPKTLEDWRSKINESDKYTVAQKNILTKLINGKLNQK